MLTNPIKSDKTISDGNALNVKKIKIIKITFFSEISCRSKSIVICFLRVTLEMPSQVKYIVRSEYPDLQVPSVSLAELIESKIDEAIRKDPNSTILVS